MTTAACRNDPRPMSQRGTLVSGGITIEPQRTKRVARQAFTDFGKGPHPAGLNYGDCFSYALSKATREPLLFKGKDFAKIDLSVAHKN
jgi:ribonuclease VapC